VQIWLLQPKTGTAIWVAWPGTPSGWSLVQPRLSVQRAFRSFCARLGPHRSAGMPPTHDEKASGRPHLVKAAEQPLDGTG
jgi:hypothetical protein